MFGLITRRRYLRDLAAERAETRRVKQVKDSFWRQRDEAMAAARTAAEKFVEADATNRRLAGRNVELTRRLEDTTEGVYVAQLETRLRALAKGTGRWMLAVWSRDRRIGILQQQLTVTRTNLVASQARVAELHEELRKAEAAADPRPPEGGARRPGRRDDLRAARDHAAALDRRLSEVTAANANCTCGGAA